MRREECYEATSVIVTCVGESLRERPTLTHRRFTAIPFGESEDWMAQSMTKESRMGVARPEFSQGGGLGSTPACASRFCGIIL